MKKYIAPTVTKLGTLDQLTLQRVKGFDTTSDGDVFVDGRPLNDADPIITSGTSR